MQLTSEQQKTVERRLKHLATTLYKQDDHSILWFLSSSLLAISGRSIFTVLHVCLSNTYFVKKRKLQQFASSEVASSLWKYDACPIYHRDNDNFAWNLQQCPSTNITAVFGCIAQSRIMVDKNDIARYGYIAHSVPVGMSALW